MAILSKKVLCIFIAFLNTIFMVNAQHAILFDDDWRFLRGDDSLAYNLKYDDSKWRTLDLPHDWSIEDIPGTNSPFDSNAVGGVHTGFTVGGTGWYRKTFTMPSNKKAQRVIIQFDGVYMNADCWINGHHLGNHPYGYTSFYYDLSEYINWNGPNTIAVQVKNEGRNSRWYSGSGIYRHVWLSVLKPLHLKKWGTFISTQKVNNETAEIHISSTISNKSKALKNATLNTIIKDEQGKKLKEISTGKDVAAGGDYEFKQQYVVTKPSLWSPENPALYTAVMQLKEGNEIVETESIKFGIRSISFNPENGFVLNGKSYKLKGGCVHHDNGPLGAKAYDRAEERKVQLLKESGYNALRTSHNPPSQAFLEACDRLGMLVIDEAFDTWNERKNRQDYHLYFEDWWQRDLTSMVHRDRNHPSVIMWSIGNEIPNRGKPEVGAVAAKLAAFVHLLDSTRPVTAGVNGIDQKPEAFLNALDVAGYNYAVASYDNDHEQHPSRVMYGSESFPLDAYDYWIGVKKYPWVVGDFVWTAFDYIGEASIGWLGYPQSKDFFPWNLAFCGDIDVCGWKRPQSFYRDALWKKDQLSVFVKPPVPTFSEWNEKLEAWSRWYWPDVVKNWNWKGFEDTILEVSVYSSCDEVELLLNDVSIGRKRTGVDEKYMTTFNVPYAPGTLTSIGYTNNKPVLKEFIRTSGEPYAIRLTAERSAITADNQDLVFVKAEVIDNNGVLVPDADIELNFHIDGPATIAGLGNANPKSIESFQGNKRKTWQGKCLLILKSAHTPGAIEISAEAKGLNKGKLSIQAGK